MDVIRCSDSLSISGNGQIIGAKKRAGEEYGPVFAKKIKMDDDNNVKKIEAREISYADVTEKVRVACEVSSNVPEFLILGDFLQEDRGEYFFARRKDKEQTYGLMCIGSMPEIKIENGFSNTVLSDENTLWIESLVSSEGTGLGSYLLDKAEMKARHLGKQYVALAAFEFDSGDMGISNENTCVYTTWPFYEEKFDYSYCGMCTIENSESGDKQYLPIYYKSTVTVNED